MGVRDPGWYWVKLPDDEVDNSGNGWQVGNYENGYWALVGVDARWSDDDFSIVGPRVEKPE